MIYPDDAVMVTLVALCVGTAVDLWDDDTMVLHLRNGKAFRLEEHAVAELEQRGWLDLCIDGQIQVTDQGRYWCDRWERTQR